MRVDKGLAGYVDPASMRVVKEPHSGRDRSCSWRRRMSERPYILDNAAALGVQPEPPSVSLQVGYGTGVATVGVPAVASSSSVMIPSWRSIVRLSWTTELSTIRPHSRRQMMIDSRDMRRPVAGAPHWGKGPSWVPVQTSQLTTVSSAAIIFSMAMWRSGNAVSHVCNRAMSSVNLGCWFCCGAVALWRA
jgi:hypothetical protein